MKLHQLRYLAAVAQNGLNITAAAQKLHTSQPGVSKQLKLLEDELGFQIFARDGRNLTQITPAGEQVIERALRILREVHSIKSLSEELRDETRGALSIGTTHTQARYVLPGVIKSFRERYPEIRLHLHQGTSEQIAEMAQLERIDFAIATGSQQLFADMVLLPCYRWHRCVVVPRGHKLAGTERLTLKDVAEHPIVTYVFGFTGPSSLHEIFARANLVPDVVLTARDADVIKTYVRLGLGVGIVASMAIEQEEDRDLVTIDASHLFPAHVTWVGFPRGLLLRKFMYEFLQLFAPHLNRRLVDRAQSASWPRGRGEDVRGHRIAAALAKKKRRPLVWPTSWNATIRRIPLQVSLWSQPGVPRYFRNIRAHLDSDMAKRRQLDRRPVTRVLGGHTVVRDKDPHWHAGQVRDVRTRQRLAPRLEELSKRECSRGRPMDVDPAGPVMRVQRVVTVVRGRRPGDESKLGRERELLPVQENREMRVHVVGKRLGRQALMGPDRLPLSASRSIAGGPARVADRV